MKRRYKLFAVLVVCLLSLGSIGYLGLQHSEKAAYADGTFTPIDLGINLTPVGISDSGIVAGNVSDDSGYGSHPVTWQAGSFTNLSSPTGTYGRSAHGIGSTGEVVGGYQANASSFSGIYAVKWDSTGTPTDLGVASSTSSNCNHSTYSTWAFAVNDVGDIGGYCQVDYSKAGYWPGGTPNTFTQLPDVSGGIGHTVVTGINHNDDMVGSAEVHATDTGYVGHAVFWKNGTATDISPSGSGDGFVNAINDNDLAAGNVYFTNSNGSHPYVWDLANNQTYDLSSATVTSGVATSVNNSGIVVGYYYAANGGLHAFMWKIGDNGITDINDLLPTNSGWELQIAYGINSSGQIVGTGTLNGESHAFLLNASTTSSYRLSLAPASQTATIRGGQGLVKATLLDGATSAPASNVKLSFRVKAGPNAGISGTCFPSSCTTDANGQVDWGYLGTTIGGDTVQAWMDTNGNGVPDTGEPQTTATVTWIPRAATSKHWAGYVAQHPLSIHPVSSRVTLPHVRCNQAGTAAIWVGYDGTPPGSNTVEQEGINATCSKVGGKVAFSLWWELYNGNPPKGAGNGPQVPIRVPVTLVAGDNVYLLVNRITQKSGVDKIYFSIHVDDPAGRSLWQMKPKTEPEPKGFNATYNTAECIAEAPYVQSNSPTPVYSPLPDFGTLTFTNCSVIDDNATLLRLDMSRSGHLLASTSSVRRSVNGENSFSVTWVSSS